jgi:ribosomal protein S7
MLFKKNLYSNLLGFFIKKGKKLKSKKILDNAFFLVSKKTGFSFSYILFTIFLKLNIFVEAKKVKIKRRSHIVPFSISLKRRSYLVTKWLMQSILQNTYKKPTSLKLSEEILNLLIEKTSKSLKMKTLNNSQALLNRSNIHYRW